MRPVRLTFAGLRSYRAETTVDFSHLDLFAVIGDTGSGKSTLIEALCLALYARKSWSGGESALSDMITDGVNTMRIELTFVAGEHEWTVTRARHRNNSSPMDRLVSSTGGNGADGARAVTQRVSELIGLTYDQFTRAVVLPQGRFDSLLRATERERNQILTSILDLGDIAATRSRAEAVRNAWAPTVVGWNAERRQFPLDPAADVAAAERSEQQAAALDQRLGVAVDEVERLDAEIGSTAELRRRLSEALTEPQVLSPTLSTEVTGLRDEWLRIDQLTAEAKAEGAASTGALAALDCSAIERLRGAPDRDALVTARGALERVVAEMPHAVEALRVARANLELREGVGPEMVSTAELEATVDRAVAALNAAEEGRRDAERRVELAATAWGSAVAAINRHGETLATKRELDNRIENGTTLFAEAEARLAAAEAQVEAARAAEHAALVADAAATAAADCHPGDDCPVCARELPSGFIPPVPSTDVTSARTAAAAALEVHKECRRETTTIGDLLTTLMAQAPLRVDEVETAHHLMSEAVEAARTTGVDPSAESEATAVADVRAALDRATAAAGTAADTHRAAAGALNNAKVAAAVAAETHRRELAEATNERDRAERDVARLRASLAGLPGEWGGDIRDDDVVASAESLAESLREAIDDLQANEAERANLSVAALNAERHIEQLGHQLAEQVLRPLDELVARANSAIAWARRLDEMAKSGASGASPGPGRSVGSVGLAPLTSIRNVDDLDVLVSDLEARTFAVDAVVAAARHTLADLNAQASSAESALTDLLASVGCETAGLLQQRRGEARVSHATAVTAAATARTAADRAVVLDRRLSVAAPFVANVTTLATALRDQHFIAHLVDAREQELLAEASRRLKDITSGRFGFVADFGIVDVSSGEVRTPDALSGGERFQAALALALGLVEIASRGSGRLDAVFVDEGFGSLDGNSLDDALATLGKVAGGGKMVALISHLRHVAESVDTVLMVTKDDMFGSQIELLDAEQREQLLADDIRSGLTS